jgi:hypothetical protein
MKRAHLLTSLCVAGVLSTGVASVGCGRADGPETSASAEAGEAHGDAGRSAQPGMPEHGQDLAVSGCLTANIDGRSYALTPSDATPSAAGETLQMAGRETITYELVGNAEDFRRHANTLVTARGRTDASARREAEMERTDEAEQQPAAGTKDTPTVETKEEVEVNVQRLHVASVVGTGNPCPSLGQGDGRATGAPAPAGTGGGSQPRPEGQR